MVAGYSDTSTAQGAPIHASVAVNNSLQDLGTLGGTFSNALAINDDNVVAGVSTTSTGDFHAFLWERSVGMVDLGPRGTLSSSISGLNNLLETVGSNRTSTAAYGFVTSGRKLIDLNTLATAPSKMFRGQSISDSGFIAAVDGTSPNFRAVLLVPRGAAAGLPDLTASWSDLTLSVTGSGRKQVAKLTGTFTVKNQGTAAAGPSHTLLYASTDGTLIPGALVFGDLKLGPMAAGATQTFPVNITFRRGFDVSSLHGKIVAAVLDSARQVPESNEANNVALSSPLQ